MAHDYWESNFVPGDIKDLRFDPSPLLKKNRNEAFDGAFLFYTPGHDPEVIVSALMVVAQNIKVGSPLLILDDASQKAELSLIDDLCSELFSEHRRVSVTKDSEGFIALR